MNATKTKTVAVQIGNTDDKLSQLMWSAFIRAVADKVYTHAAQVHFSGYSDPSETWQNAAWIFEIDEEESQRLWGAMKVLASLYNQDSIAWTEGNTIFAEAIK